MKLVFATHNANKLNEVKQLPPPSIVLLSLTDIENSEEIEETGTTLHENAYIKARYVRDRYNLNCFADDSGLEIEALNGAPEVISAFAILGPKKEDNEANILNVWNELKDKTNEAAQFRTVIALCLEGEEWDCEGIVRGKLIHQKRGEKGNLVMTPFYPPKAILRPLQN